MTALVWYLALPARRLHPVRPIAKASTAVQRARQALRVQGVSRQARLTLADTRGECFRFLVSRSAAVQLLEVTPNGTVWAYGRA